MNDLAYRPPIGCIVEGKDEYYCYPTIISKILNVRGMHIPIIVANGYSGILNHLEEHLEDLVSTVHPVNVIISIDLLDVINANIFNNCVSLFNKLSTDIDNWITLNNQNNNFLPFPDIVSIIIQIQRLETWFIADKYTLNKNNDVYYSYYSI